MEEDENEDEEEGEEEGEGQAMDSLGDMKMDHQNERILLKELKNYNTT